ncbi:MAG: hypothetical protein ACYCS4_00915 [Acidimicrobiales bacterium]
MPRSDSDLTTGTVNQGWSNATLNPGRGQPIRQHAGLALANANYPAGDQGQQNSSESFS